MTLIQQQRLIGALLLVCFFSGIAYFLMSSAKQTEEPIFKSIEPEQAFTSSIEAISDNVEVISDEAEMLIDPHNLKSEEAVIDKEPIPVTAVIQKEVEKEVAIAVPVQVKSNITKSDSWFLQLASFSVKKNAQALQKQVSSLGYSAKVQASEGSKGTVYRVRIGPDNSKPALEKTSLVLNKKLGLKSQIVKNTNK